MRILALVTDGFGGFGGIARYNTAFLSALAAQPAVQEVVVVPRSGRAERAPPKVRQIPAAAGKAAFVARVMGLLVRDRRFDLVWCGHINFAPLAVILARVIGSPWWLQLHGVDAWDPPGPLLAIAVERMDLALSVSRYTKQRFLGWTNLPPERVRVLANVVGREFTPGERPSHLVRRYRVEGRRLLLTVARLSSGDAYKGVDRVLAVLPLLAGRFPDLSYLVVGDGDDRPRLEALARKQGVADRVIFAGRIDDAELVEHYRLADVFVMPSTKEGFGIVFLEAMACGVPAVGLDVDGSVDPLSLAPLGRAVPEHELATTIVDLLVDPPPRRPPPRIQMFSLDTMREGLARLLGALPRHG